MPATKPDIRVTGSPTTGLRPAFLDTVLAAAADAGATVLFVISGRRTPSWNAAVGGVQDSNHLTGDAIDARAFVPGRGWVPLGTLLRDTAASHGLRSGDQPGFFHGQPDPNHVDDGSNVGGTTASSAIKSTGQFFAAVLTSLGLSPTPARLAFLEGWAQVEGTAAKNNPLATTQKTDNSVALPGNPDGVQQYPTPEEGVRATAATLRNYPGVMYALTSGSPVHVLAQRQHGIQSDLARWSGNANNPAGAADYYRKVLLAAQGNPGGKSASDIGSYDLGNAAKDAAGAVTGPIGQLLDFLKGYGIRAAEVVGGFVLVLAGLYLLARRAGAPAPPGAP